MLVLVREPELSVELGLSIRGMRPFAILVYVLDNTSPVKLQYIASWWMPAAQGLI